MNARGTNKSFASLVMVLVAAIAGCSSDAAEPRSDAGFIYLDANDDLAEVANDDASMEDASPADAPPLSCALVMTEVSPSAGCRADWSCAGAGLYTFVCGTPDGGASTCYCIAADQTQTSGPIDACSGGAAGVRGAAQTLCGWSFAATAVPDGGTP